MFASPLTHKCYDDINQSTLERRVAMADPTFIGNWNLFMGRISDEEGIRVQNSTWKIEPGNDGYVKVEMSTGERAGLRLSNASGYLEATGSTPNWFSNNYIFLVLSQDGSMFHGAVKQSENDPPLPWWGVRQ